MFDLIDFLFEGFTICRDLNIEQGGNREEKNTKRELLDSFAQNK